MSRIVFLLESLSQGGSERQMLYACKAMAEAGNSVRIFQYSTGNFYGELASNIGVELIQAPLDNKFHKLLWIRKELKKTQPDYIVALVKSASMYAFITSLGLKNTQLILSWRFADATVFSKSYNLILNVFKNKIKTVICNSYNGSNLWIANRPQDREKVQTIYNVVNVNVSSTDRYVESNKIEITVPARVQKVKNPEMLIEGLNAAKRETKDAIHISWYGRDESGGKYRQQLNDYITKLGLSESIWFYDATNDIYSKMRDSDMIALFSSREGFPNAICEGMLLSKAILMTAVSDYKYMVDATNGYLIEKLSKDSIAGTLNCIAKKSKKELREMGKASFLKGSILFDNKSNSDKWAELVK